MFKGMRREKGVINNHVCTWGIREFFFLPDGADKLHGNYVGLFFKELLLAGPFAKPSHCVHNWMKSTRCHLAPRGSVSVLVHLKFPKAEAQGQDSERMASFSSEPFFT